MPHPLGPSDQSDVIPSLPALNVSYTLIENSLYIDIEIPLIDDVVSLESTERVRYRLVLHEGTVGVEPGDPIVTYINILDDDGECILLLS